MATQWGTVSDWATVSLTGVALAGAGIGWVYEYRQRRTLAKAAEAQEIQRIARAVVAWIVPNFSKFQKVLIQEGWFSQATPCVVVQSQLSYPVSSWSLTVAGDEENGKWHFSSKEHGPIPPVGSRLVISTPALGSEFVRNVLLKFSDPSGRAIDVEW